MFERFTEKAIKVVMLSQEESRRLGHNFVGTEQILLGLIGEGTGVAYKVLRSVNLTLKDARMQVERIIGRGSGFVAVEIPFTPRAKRVLENSIEESRDLGHGYIGTEHILLALLDEDDGVAWRLFEDLKIDIEKLRADVLVAIGADAAEMNAVALVMGSEDDDREYSLEEYTTNLTDQAKEGSLDPVVGRVKEIERVVQILVRRKKNNPVLIGEPGVGKTAVVEGLAIRIGNDDVPEKLKGKEIFCLDLASILAGAKFRGDFEERLKSLLIEIEKQKNKIILFIDELHSLVGAGGVDGSLDASNIFKPALARGELHCVGATTFDEYRKYIEKDKALERRFQQVYIDEPDIENSISMMRGLKERYELFHGIAISDKALTASVNLSSQYINDRYLPDKAIDLIDEAASRKRIEIDSKPDSLDEIDRRIIQLQIEKKALKKENNQPSNDRILKVESELKELGVISKKETEKWKSNKRIIEEEQERKIQLETYRNELEIEKRKGNWDRAGELSYQIIPNLEKMILESKVLDDLVNTTVTEDDVATVVSKWTGIPVEKMLEFERTKLLNIEMELKKSIIGQDYIISAIAKTIIRSRVGISDGTSPIGSFLFLGSTGVGKTCLLYTSDAADE